LDYTYIGNERGGIICPSIYTAKRSEMFQMLTQNVLHTIYE